jgi:hypothetical protein
MRKDFDVTMFSLYILGGRVYRSDYQLKADLKGKVLKLSNFWHF